MKLDVLAALDQRIGLRYAIPPMTGEETSSYLRHHLTLAGRSDPLFSDDATALIHQTSRGYPRAVNNLALQALAAAFAADKAIVDESSTRAGSPRSPPNDYHDQHPTLITKPPPRRPGPSGTRRRGLRTSTTSSPSMAPTPSRSTAANTLCGRAAGSGGV
ncbi:hypothetical protein GCM10009609_36400 [Pseudonocardia aurantiaca]|uniref:Uncharacterized protein n=1 Tax=Pseudonocardia aurantiaca TaxID=75290 RepID=A0ABW4FT49_9PSEU